MNTGTYETLTKKLYLLRGVHLEIHKKNRCSFDPPQNTLPIPNQGEKDSEGAILISDKETSKREYKRHLVVNAHCIII